MKKTASIFTSVSFLTFSWEAPGSSIQRLVPPDDPPWLLRFCPSFHFLNRAVMIYWVNMEKMESRQYRRFLDVRSKVT
jgi:hypothetical protein